ncbi:Protein NPHP-4 [Aphelenchoides avenae]|nr:Protein NPHP-4 [Aphelenchus avenae]
MPSIPRESEAHMQQPYEPYTARVSSLPRGVAVYLSRQDFPLIRDRNGEVPRAVDPFAKRAINTELELRDRLDTNEVVLQFLAFMPLSNTYISTNTRSSHYFFTFQFYRFREVTTERLLAHSGREWRPTEPAVLKRIDENNRLIEDDGNGFMVKFTIDKSSMSPADPDDFAQYLSWHSLYIDVWNADSLIHIGTAAVPLKFLCRQGTEAVQATLQCPVVQNSLPGDPVTTSLLYLRLASIGHPSNSQIDLYESTNTAAVVSQRLVRLGADTKSKFRLRARPLSAIHDSALQRFLNIQKLDIHQRKEEVFSNQNIYRIQQWNEMKKGSNEQPPAPTKAMLKRFIFQEELDAYKALRNESKASKLLKAVFRGITVNHIIRAKFGQVEFFEYVLQNTFAEPVNCAIDITDSRLSLVKNADEWKFFKASNHVKTPLERDLFYVDKDGETTIRLNSMESIFVPFKYDAFATSDPSTNGDNFEIKAIFKRTDTGEPISILELLVHNRNYTITNSYRWFHEESTRLSKLLRISGVKDNQRILGLRVTDPTVLCSLRNTPNAGQELLLTCYAGESPSTKSFVVFLYADTHHHRLLAAWKIIVHAVQRLNVEGIQGQTTKIPLYLRRTGQEETVQFFSSTEALSFIPSQPIMATSHAITDVKALLVPNFTGSRAAVVTAVDASSRHLLSIWMLQVAVREPNIVKTYAIEIPLAETKTVQKRLSFENQYSIPRKFRLHTSNEQLVSVQHEYYEVAPREVVTVLLNFQPVRLNRPTTVQAILFVENAETAQQEEAYALKISYTG